MFKLALVALCATLAFAEVEDVPKHQVNGCFVNEAIQTMLCRCDDPMTQIELSVPRHRRHHHRLFEINFQCCSPQSAIDVDAVMARLPHFKGLISIEGGCCYKTLFDSLPDGVRIAGAQNCDNSIEYDGFERAFAEAIDELPPNDEAHSDDGYVVLDESDNTDPDNQVVESYDDILGDCNINGYWYNEHGSELLLKQFPNGRLVGEYRTAVERECGTAGSSYSNVTGYVSSNMFTFNVHWAGKGSVATWAGQCHKQCSHGLFTPQADEEILFTTWILVAHQDTCDGAWMQNRVGQNLFLRRQLKKGPRRVTDTHTPDRAPECQAQ